MEELIIERRSWDQHSCDKAAACTFKIEKKEGRTSLVLLGIVLVFLLSIGAVFSTYCVKKVMQYLHPQYELCLMCNLPTVGERMPIYSAESLDSDNSISSGIGIGDAVGAKYNVISYSEDRTYFIDSDSENSVHLLILSNKNGNFRYWSRKGLWTGWADAERAVIEQSLADFHISIPSSATFSAEGNGWYLFTVENFIEENHIISGTVRCRYASDGRIKILENNLTSYSLSSYMDVLSPEEAIQELKDGKYLRKSDLGDNKKVTITSAAIKYFPGEENSCEPYYVFTAQAEESNLISEVRLPLKRMLP